MALDVGAMPWGHWSGCHAVGWDRNAPDFGDLAVGDGFQKHSYPFGIMVNADGERFVDEGADFRNYTYAKYGRVILAQPQQFAWQIFDAKVDPPPPRRVPDPPGDAGARRTPSRHWSAKLDGVDAERVPPDRSPTYNAAVDTGDRSTRTSRTAGGTDGPGRAQVELGQHRSTRRRSRRTRSPAASPSPSAACGSSVRTRCWTPTASPSAACTPPGSWSAGSSTSTTRAGAG